MDREINREAYLLGRAALKTKIKALAAKQTAAKKILRMPRKTDEQRKAFREACDANTGWGQWQCQLRRMEITAYLNIYAEIRGKESSNPMGKDYTDFQYNRFLKEARELFDTVTSAKEVEQII